MRGFLSLFSDSARELKQVRTLTISALFMALSIVLRSIAIPLGTDIRITFSFLGIMVIAMLYGPVVTMIANLGTDLIGYLLDGVKMREYNLLLSVVVLLNGLIYGIFLYHRKTQKNLLISAILARLTVVVIGNLVLNSAILYGCYINPDFPLHMQGSAWAAFGMWMVSRLIKNFGQFPFDAVMICVLLPIVITAYRQVFHKSALTAPAAK